MSDSEGFSSGPEGEVQYDSDAETMAQQTTQEVDMGECGSVPCESECCDDADAVCEGVCWVCD